MADVKWIRLNVNMTDNRKIKRIRRLPDGNNIVLFWVFIITKAGESNEGGALYFLENMPYTVEDLADEFDFSHDFVRFALKTLEKLEMVELYDDIIYIKNWEKYQNADGLEKIREQTRQRVAKHREKKRLEQPKEDVTLQVTQGNATELDLELELEQELEQESNNTVVEKLDNDYSTIVKYLNKRTTRNYRATTPKTKTLIDSRMKEGFTVEDFKTVIDKKVYEWIEDESFKNYLRPETLFGTKFEGYLNQDVVKSKKESPESILDSLRKDVQDEQRTGIEHTGSNTNELL